MWTLNCPKSSHKQLNFCFLKQYYQNPTSKLNERKLQLRRYIQTFFGRELNILVRFCKTAALFIGGNKDSILSVIACLKRLISQCQGKVHMLMRPQPWSRMSLCTEALCTLSKSTQFQPSDLRQDLRVLGRGAEKPGLSTRLSPIWIRGGHRDIQENILWPRVRILFCIP